MAADSDAPSVEECLAESGASLHPWQVEKVRRAFARWLGTWDGLGMSAEDLRERV